MDTSTKGMLQPGLLHEVALDVVDGRLGWVMLVADDSRVAAILADWDDRRRVELMVAGRPLALEADLDGPGIRVFDPVTCIPLAAFRPARRGGGGMVELPGTRAVRWVVPRGSVFECGFLSRYGGGLIRFARDCTALVLVDDDRRRRGGIHDPLVLLTLGWFLLLKDQWRRDRGSSAPPAARITEVRVCEAPPGPRSDSGRPVVPRTERPLHRPEGPRSGARS
ncbi:hypothetical protein [Frankia sp. Cas3]|uniref:hypothetical protein n=1 Tax=Frankia sp. Cas3 TaxID=3073926 RepID=UPI002AD32070|nr:hypothetical protein [Frankia sp. Cas3]